MTVRKVDTVYVERKATPDVSIEAFHISDMQQAKNLAANMTAYHNEPFVCVVKNEGRDPAARKTVAIEKRAKGVLQFVTVYHQNAISGQREVIC